MFVSMTVNEKTIIVDTTTGLWDYLHEGTPKVQGVLFNMILSGEIHKHPDSLGDLEALIVREEVEKPDDSSISRRS